MFDRKIFKSFKKVRIKRQDCLQIDNPEVEELLKRKTSLLNKSNYSTNEDIKPDEVKQVDDKIQCLKSFEVYKTIKDHIKQCENLEGSFCQQKLWKLKQKIIKTNNDPPMAKIDFHGNVVTSRESLKALYLKTYKDRLHNSKMSANHEEIYFLKMRLWESRLESMKKKKTENWKEEDVLQAVSDLKVNKTRDPSGILNETIKDAVLSKDFLTALTCFVNGIKTHLHIPYKLMHENITSIYKGKGSRLSLENDRGIFTMTIWRKLIDRLTYNDLYDNIDKHMSDSNIGARKAKNIRNHLFVVYAIMNDVLLNKKESVTIQIFDLVKAFDKLWLEESMNDLVDSLDNEHHNDKLALIFESNKTNMVAVNTPVGQTKRINMPHIVQ